MSSICPTHGIGDPCYKCAMTNKPDTWEAIEFDDEYGLFWKESGESFTLEDLRKLLAKDHATLKERVEKLDTNKLFCEWNHDKGKKDVERMMCDECQSVTRFKKAVLALLGDEHE